MIFAVVLLGFAFALMSAIGLPAAAQEETGRNFPPQLSGFLVDDLEQPVVAAEVRIFLDGAEEAVAHIESKEDGSWVVDLPETPQQSVRIEIERAHFQLYERELTEAEFQQL